MSENDLITLKEFAELIGKDYVKLQKYRSRLKGFPKPVKVENSTYYFNKSEALKYKAPNNQKRVTVKKIVKNLSLEFLSGKFDPKSKQKEYQKKKDKAEKDPPFVYKIHMHPEWYYEED